MVRIYAAVVLALVLGALLPAATPHAETRPMPNTAMPGATNPEFMGMVVRDPFYEFNSNPDFPNQPNYVAQDAMGRLLANAGVRWVRLEFIADGDGHVNFAKYDYFIGTVAPRYGLKVLGLLTTNSITRFKDATYYPYKLNLDPTNLSDQRFGFSLNQYMIDWLDEALRVAGHYSGSTPGAGRVHAFELFNEMNRLLGDGTNLPAGIEYAGLNPQYVARMHAKFYRVCKNTDGSQPAAACPNDTQIILGGLHPKGTSARRNANQPETFTYTDEQYLQAMYTSGFTDFKNNQSNLPPWRGTYPLEGVGFHPYPEEIMLTIQGVYEDVYLKIAPRLNQVRAMLGSVGDQGRPFWITEIGYNIAFYKNRGPLAASNQADFMREVYTTLAARGDVANVFWFKYEDFPPADGPNAQMWGVVRIPFTAGACEGGACYATTGEPELVRPAYLVYRELAGLPILRAYLPVAGN